jgi:hypothetical protein
MSNLQRRHPWLAIMPLVISALMYLFATGPTPGLVFAPIAGYLVLLFTLHFIDKKKYGY